MTKMRVYEIARDLGMENKALVALLQSIGVSDVRNHMSVVGPDAVERVRRHLEKQAAPKAAEERIRPTVVKRRAPARPAGEVKVTDVGVDTLRSSPVAASSPRAADVVLKSAPQAAPPPLPSAPRHEPPPPAMEPPPSVEEVAPPSVEAQPPASAPLPSAPVVEAPPPPVEAVAPPVEAAPPPVEAAPAPSPTPPPAPRPSSPPKTGIEVWEGRPGVTMPARTQPTPRRVQYDAKAGTGLGARGQRGGPGMGGPMGRPMGGRPGQMRGRGIGQFVKPKGTGQVVTQERSAHKKVVKIEGSTNLQTLAGRMGIKATEVLMKLMRLGMTGVNINSTLDADTAKIVASEFGWEVSDVAVSEEDALVAAQGLETEEDQNSVGRPPVVTVMGHVDHGKTSLLDKIRKANVVAGEAGGITQHIGAYSVDTPHGKLTFLDTPGHEAFTAMRARGAQTTDVVILVVAADDGVMPQTVEALNHAKAAQVPIIVAINKCDKPDAQPERARRELSEHGLVPEEWGGDAMFAEVSAHTGAGIDDLLEKVVLQSEVLELRANPEKPATGVVVEAELDRGRGPVATILVQDGTLNRGDTILAGAAWGKVRAMLDDRGRMVATAGPATPVSVIGLDDVPSAGDPVHVIKDVKKAQEIAESRKVKERRSLMPGTARVSLEDLAKAMSETDQLELKLIIKADVQGSVEALRDALVKMSTNKVKVSVVHAAVGAITEGDVNLAVAAKGIIIGFNVRPAGKATGLAQQEGVQIRQYSIIYNVVDDVKAAMEGLLAPTLVEKELGKAEVRQVFKLSKAGTIAGSMVVQGLARRSATARLVRDGTVVWSGKVSSLKRFKDDAREVKEGFDCGIGLEGYNDLKEGDFIEFFEMEEVKQTL
ncbi:MAG: translation initiation factor IF-2 [Polyangiaceae bacterium]|nr:translation initiation factor IF-2 [Polyangiaceae bacterium]MCL4749374.1 translation initiation factor IF-2 [Myxococcales bacterium]